MTRKLFLFLVIFGFLFVTAAAGDSGTYPLYTGIGIAVGTGPTSVTAADLGNGQPDVVVANRGDNTVGVLLGNGDGTFQPQVTYSVGKNPDSVVTADLGNGHLDIVAANSSDNSVSVLLGNGDGTFKSQVTYPVGTNPTAVVVADLGNGQQDIVVTNSVDNTVGILFGNGDGTFQPQITYTASTSMSDQPEAVAVADLGTGHPSIVVGTNNGEVEVLLGNSDGTFQYPVVYIIGSVSESPAFISSISIMDLGNGHPDVVTADNSNTGVSVLVGNGDGTFQQPSVDYNVGISPSSVALMDLGNGHPDIVTVGSYYGACGCDVTVLLGKGDGTFQTGSTFYPTGVTPESVVLMDLGNGHPDAIVANSGGNSLTVLLGYGNGAFQIPGTYPAGTSPTGIAVADLGNGHADVVVANPPSNIVTVLLGSGNGAFPSPTSYAVGNFPTSVAIADLGNGHPDLVVGNSGDGTVGVLLGNGDGTFQAQTTFLSPVAGTGNVAVMDLGNGHPDIVVANGPSVGVLLGNGDGTFQQGGATYALGNNATSLALADLGNGHPDIVVFTGSCSLSNPDHDIATVDVEVLLGNGDGTFQPEVSYGIPAVSFCSIFGSVAVGNFGNGHPGIVVADISGVNVLLGNGDGTFQPVVTYAINGNPAYLVAVAYVNGDGLQDIVTESALNASVLLGNGDGTFQPPLTYPTYDLAGIVVADVNGDGWPDILGTDANDGFVTVMLHLNPAPAVSAGNLTLAENGTVSGTLAATDAYGLPLTYSLVSGPVHGMLSSINSTTGRFTYTSASGFTGTDSFNWQVANGHASSTTTETLTVTGNGSGGSGNSSGGGLGLLSVLLLVGIGHWRLRLINKAP